MHRVTGGGDVGTYTHAHMERRAQTHKHVSTRKTNRHTHAPAARDIYTYAHESIRIEVHAHTRTALGSCDSSPA